MKEILSGKTRGLLSRLQERKIMPLNVEITKISNIFSVSVCDRTPTRVIDENVYTGMDYSLEIAMLKCLSEMIERRAMNEWLEGKVEYESFGSDGFAAFPSEYPDASHLVKSAAYFEAIERYCWAKWWDDDLFGAEIHEVSFGHELGPSITELMPIERIYKICPYASQTGFVEIYFCSLKGGGYISGGAAGSPFSKDTKLRALSELYRHAEALRRLLETNYKRQLSFYEQRLLFFGTGQGDQLVEARLNRRTSKQMALPSLELDMAVEHSNGDLFKVHKCQFQNQPLFIGGPIERLCL